MSATVDLQQASIPDKLRLMEALWMELSKEDVASAGWHGAVLGERDRLNATGAEKFLDWETAQQLRKDSLAGKIRMAPDFDGPREDFKDYTR